LFSFTPAKDYNVNESHGEIREIMAHQCGGDPQLDMHIASINRFFETSSAPIGSIVRDQMRCPPRNY
jgi:hypothetical protein